MESVESSFITLIDFSVSTTFLDKDGAHKPDQDTHNFSGNLIYSSLHVMKLKSKFQSLNKIAPSRRDDMMSVMYLLLYLKQGSLPWMGRKQG